MGKRQQRTVGAIVVVPIEDYSVHAQILADTEMVFFDTKDRVDLTPPEILTSGVLFRVPVHDTAVLDGRWVKMAKEPVREENLKHVPRFIQDTLDPGRFEIYEGGEIRPSSRDECEHLERCAVWAANHVEDRIRDHYRGVTNLWVEQMRLK
ncbi:hypothetical protein [uncultured Halopseudomonas sp.]|uniref:hypothetical protein n=1 Tax=uncultured Halopseudomonas sp. TaxID=2901193 RepID=UPI0030EF5DF4|tara:strand:- start:638 stop:1090 length:453 start_codon:yes stop_codon:yes gene_type:complete